MGERRKRRTEREEVAYQDTDLVDSKVNHVRSTCRAERNREIGEGNRRVQRYNGRKGKRELLMKKRRKKRKGEKKQKRADALVFMPRPLRGRQRV